MQNAVLGDRIRQLAHRLLAEFLARLAAVRLQLVDVQLHRAAVVRARIVVKNCVKPLAEAAFFRHIMNPFCLFSYRFFFKISSVSAL